MLARLKSSAFAIEPMVSNINTIDDLLNFNLQKKMIRGLFPEEVIVKAYYNTPEINRNKIAILDGISDLDTLVNSGNTDFMVAPIYKDEHFISAVVHFIDPPKDDGKNREIFVFDSQQENDVPYINTSDGLNENPQLLNTINLQGNSETCGYFTAEFIGLASQFPSFEALWNNCINVGEVQRYIYNKVSEILERNSKNLDRLHGSHINLIRSLNRMGSGVGYCKLSPRIKYSSDQQYSKQSESQPSIQKSESSHYWRDKVKRSKSTPNLSKTGYFLG